MRRAAIVSPVRTPVGMFGGAFRNVAVEHLAATVVKAALGRSGLDPAAVEDVVFSQSYANGETPCVGRWAALEADCPVEVPGLQLDRRCGGGLQAIVTAAMMVQSGAADVVVAGGVESMSRIEYYTTDMRWGARLGSTKFHDRLERGRERSQPERRFGYIAGMIETAEIVSRQCSISRERADEYAALSHARAHAASKTGRFDDEIVAVDVPQRGKEPLRVSRDEGIRPETTTQTLGRLRPIIKNGAVTAGNSSQQSDAAAACLIVAEDRLAPLGLEPIAFLADWAVIGCEPALMGLGPVPAVAKLMKRANLSLDDMDLVELNEAFACQVLAVLDGWDWHDHDKLNVNGSGIALGHPIGATGVRIMTTLVHELRRRKKRYGLETMCIGGGQGIAAIFESAGA